MNERTGNDEPSVRVDLHCHSDVSDGYYTPAVVADLVADAGVDFAAITDHRTLAGRVPFRVGAQRRGVAAITGAEVHVMFDGREIHLLAYGFDPESTLMGNLFATIPEAAHAIADIHEAGGIVFLAHPLQTGWNGSALEAAVGQLVHLGLDGIEVYYKPYPVADQEYLASLANRLGILSSGGSDFHGPLSDGAPGPGVDMPVSCWKRFRAALGDHVENGMQGCVDPDPVDPVGHVNSGRIDWNWLFLRIVLPSLLVIGVFTGLIFGVLIPTMEDRLLERKREMAAELTNSAWSILADYHRETVDESLSVEQAQRTAVERIRRLRYGAEGKDYFWLTDMQPRMVMHPYRSDLEGTDLTDFTDPDGVRPFVEFVSAVRNGSSGYVTYVWQWQDDPERLEPKESYVRAFEPWGWIIGTGLYVDDVSREVSAITGTMIDASFIVLVVVILLLVTVAYQSLKAERRRSAAEQQLRLSHERYRTLVEAAGSGTLLVVDGRCSYANRTLLDIVGYTTAELAFLDIHDLAVAEDHQHSVENLECIAAGGEVREPFEARLKRKNGETLPVLISSTPVFFSGRQGLIVTIQDLTGHRAMQSEAERERLISQLQTSLLFLTEPVRNSMNQPVCCNLDTPISQVVRLMGRSDVNAITVIGPSRELLGIVTDQDIRERVVAPGLDTRVAVSRIMSAPVVSISENAPVFEAALLERERNVDCLAVTDTADHLVGMIQSSRAVRPDRYSLVVITQQIRRARSVEELAAIYERVPTLVGSLVDSGALPRNICHVTTAVSDGISRRVIALALEELGPAPARFAFLSLGSEAREEQTLVTDQDNAIVYADESDSDPTRPDEYFLRLGEYVCDALNEIGYRHCKGEATARNRRWNQPLSRWKQYFSGWISEPDGTALAHCNVFFDHRAIYGDTELIRRLWQHVTESVACTPAFLSHMALDTLHYRAPLGVFGKIVTESTGDTAHTFNIKEAMLPIVNYARLLALKHQIEQTNTFDRLDQLAEIGVLQQDNHRAISQAYSHLMQLRYHHQVEMIREGLEPDNSIDPRRLTQIETGTLKQTFSQISAIQKKVSFDFFRGTA